MIHFIYTRFDGRSYYWTTCGWSDRVRNSRLYTRGGARSTLDRMQADGVSAAIAKMK
jgi:hypothetical protein